MTLQVPKPSSIRQRRNRTSTAAELSPLVTRRKVPPLPEREEHELVPSWHPRTVLWWRDIWRSPMAPEFLKADIHGLFDLADLQDAYHWAYDPETKRKLLAEIRLQRACFGLTPIDRRRLQWEVAKVEEVEQKRQPRTRPQPAADTDMRDVLRALA